MKERIGAKQKFIIIVVAIVVPLAMLTAVCVKLYYREFRPTPNYLRDVELELINPTTGEVIKNGDTIDLPKANTPIEIKVRDKETGRYLTDDDFPGTTIDNSLSIMFGIVKYDMAQWIMTLDTWPTYNDIEKWKEFTCYAMDINFNPKEQNVKKHDIEYNGNYNVVTFYINEFE